MVSAGTSNTRCLRASFSYCLLFPAEVPGREPSQIQEHSVFGPRSPSVEGEISLNEFAICRALAVGAR